MKVNKIVKCIEEGCYDVTVGNIYNVIFDDSNTDFYTIENDFGYSHYAKISSFECISISRNEKLEKLGL